VFKKLICTFVRNDIMARQEVIK